MKLSSVLMHVISSIELSEILTDITNVDIIPFKYLPVIPEILDTSCITRFKFVALPLFIAIDQPTIPLSEWHVIFSEVLIGT